MKTPTTMTYPEIILEIQNTRASMRADGRRIHELCSILQTRVRRAEKDDFSSRYIAYANACIRFVGGVEQAAVRTASFDRVVGTIVKEQEQAAEKLAQDAKDAKAKDAKAAKLRPPEAGGMADLVSLFGQEMIDDAAR